MNSGEKIVLFIGGLLAVFLLLKQSNSATLTTPATGYSQHAPASPNPLTSIFSSIANFGSTTIPTSAAASGGASANVQFVLAQDALNPPEATVSTLPDQIV